MTLSSLSAYRSPWQCSPLISVQMLMLKQAWYPRSRIAWGLSCAQRWLLIASCVKHASSVHRMLCKKSSSTVCWCRSHFYRIASIQDNLSGKRCALHEQWYECNWSLWSTAMTLSEQSQMSYDKCMSISLWLSFHSFTASPIAGVHTVHGWPEFMCHMHYTSRTTDMLLQLSKYISILMMLTRTTQHVFLCRHTTS
jgi:hypothetical protein